MKEFMFKQILWCQVLLLLMVLTSSAAVRVSPSDPQVRYTGRWNFDNPSIPWVGWQGSSIMVKFEGTGISVEMGGTHTDQYRVIIDGIPESTRRYFSSSTNTYVLAEGLSDSIHTMELLKETFYGMSYFHGLDVEGTGILPLPERPALRIEFYGDSNMDGSSNYSEKNSGDMGTYYAFPAMVTRMLGAEMNNQSVGGAQLYGTGDNCVGSFIFSQDYYTQDPGYRSGFDPHIIVVNAGANDIWDNSKSAIKNRYKDVIYDLRQVYGAGPNIILMNAYGWDIQEPANYTKEVVDELGDSNLSVCLFPWLWEQWHGSQWDHSGEAHVLLDHIKSLNPEWDQVNQGDIIDGFGHKWDFANGSFEYDAPFGGFGWRYYTDGVERIQDPDQAAAGDYYIRLEAGEEVHQPTDATGDFLPGPSTGSETYYISAMIRGSGDGALAQIKCDFQGQQIWTRGSSQTTTFDVTTEWESYTASFQAPAGKWTLFTTLRSSSGTVEFDSVSMSNTEHVGFGIRESDSNDEQSNEAIISPNPVSDESILSFDNPGGQPMSIQIYSSSGALIKVLRTTSNRVPLSSTEFQQGLYLYRIFKGSDPPHIEGRFIVN
ncbi:MAG: hypothetical protein DRI98_04805 [Bacteroidetes bacterium]|nr:MAG: hypothetical protein DRI98_04805 [Bacteroidota bacterium]